MDIDKYSAQSSAKWNNSWCQQIKRLEKKFNESKQKST